MRRISLFTLTFTLAGLALPAQARMLCTVIADANDGRLLFEQGDCGQRVTPASTFKIPLAVMGFDAGILHGPDAPRMSFRAGDPDWGKDWKKDTDPTSWMKNSVLWYSQRITAQMGAAELQRYGRAFAYGNADFTGDPGRDNGLERSWVSSSLKVSPREQIAFLARLVGGELPVSADAMRQARDIIERRTLAGGWTLHGKTGGAYPRKADGSFDRARGWGWFVGWATRDGQTVVYARLDQDEAQLSGSPGIRARDALIADWPRLAGELARAAPQ